MEPKHPSNDRVELHTEHGQAFPAVNIKITTLPEDLKRLLPLELGQVAEVGSDDFHTVCTAREFTLDWIDANVDDGEQRAWWEFACQDGFATARDLATETFGPHIQVEQRGRCGGWLVVRGLGDPEGWSVVDVERWVTFAAQVRALADEVPRSYLWSVHANVFEPQAEGNATEVTGASLPAVIGILDRGAGIVLKLRKDYRPADSTGIRAVPSRGAAVDFATQTTPAHPGAIWAIWPCGTGDYWVSEVIAKDPVPPGNPFSAAGLAALGDALKLEASYGEYNDLIPEYAYRRAHEIAGLYGYGASQMEIAYDWLAGRNGTPDEVWEFVDDPRQLMPLARMMIAGWDDYDVNTTIHRDGTVSLEQEKGVNP